jgi:hypothetical protein
LLLRCEPVVMFDQKAMRLAAWISAGTLLVLGDGVASAATPTEEADALIARGNDLRRAGDDLGAIPLLQQAYRVNPGPRTAAHLGMAEFAVGRWAESDLHLTEALKSPNDPWVKKNLNQIIDSLRTAKGHVSRVEITGDPAGAEVLVNGRPVGRLPLAQPIAVSAGSVDIELRAPGYQPGFRTVTLTGGQYQPVVIRLSREGQAAGTGASADRAARPPGSSTDSGTGNFGPGGPAGELAGDEDETSRPAWRPITIGVAIGGAALGLGLGGYGFWQYHRHTTAFNKRQCFETRSGGTIKPDGSTDPACVTSMSGYRNARTLQIAGFAAAGALATTALLVYLIAPDGSSTSARSPSASSLACAPAPSPGGLACALTF